MVDRNNTQTINVQSEFATISDGDALTCIQPPDGGDYWPYGGSPETSEEEGSGASTGAKVGLALGITFGVIAVAALAWFIRRWVMARRAGQKANSARQGFTRGKF